MVFRVYVEKKHGFDVEARQLANELRTILGIKALKNVRLVNRYDVEGISEELFAQATPTVFSEPQVDNVSADLPDFGTDTVFAVEYLPGQFDQRADSASECIQLISQGERPTVRSAKVYALEGDLSAEDVDAIKHYVINPVEAREASLDTKTTLKTQVPVPGKVEVIDGFRTMSDAELERFIADRGLAMDLADLQFCRAHFTEEQRDPTITEIKVIDTYWSDHCRHTTFGTQLDEVTIDDATVKAAFDKYLEMRHELGRDAKPVCLMDMGTIGAKWLKKNGILKNLDESEEINACTVKVKVDVNGQDEDWLFLFKNETHNHPTEIEPFGGAATCLGGAIRDPLSGRTYVYQAMRITGAADPTRPLGETLPGKLPQRKIVREAAHGYSSYGNQVGLATGYVKEIYHPDYVAKRMELGAVMAAAPKKNVVRMSSDPGDVIVLLGGRTGRDGIGGATGSSKIHTTASIESCGAEVQKGNAPTERKIQHMFRRPEVSLLIKKCNDFGAGGVAVAIGELAPGLTVDLDKVPLKYAGLDGTEIAISESQERMACVLDPKDVDAFLRYAEEENLEATPVAVVTAEPRLVLNWRGKAIVDLSRAFLDTNGAHLTAEVEVELPKRSENPFGYAAGESVRDKWLKVLGDLNVCSQKGLVEMFDASIGAGTVTMPYGGKYQLTETQSMIAKIPLLKGHTDAATVMSYGFDPYLSSWSPYHGAVYAVCDSVAKVAAVGGDIDKIHLTFQEFFRRMDDNKPERWSQPFAALLGAYEAQLELGLASIGGKDSMSGTFNEIDVPPTLVSFAVDVASVKDIITPELKVAGNRLVLLTVKRDGDLLPDYADLKAQYRALTEDIKAKRVLSAYVLERHGAAEAVTKMALGNGLGVKLADNVSEETLFAPGWCNLLLEVPAEALGKLSCRTELFGEVTATPVLSYRGTEISLAEAEKAWTGTLEEVFPTRVTEGGEILDRPLYHAASVAVCGHKIGTPRVFIPVFPGTNCEYDSARAFEEVGAVTSAPIFRNQNAEDIAASVEAYRNEIRNAQIVMFPGGFSAGDEPDGSAKFFAQVFRNEVVKEELLKLLNERDGLVLGICNGFQALIKLGLLPDANIKEQAPDAPTLAMNRIGRHLSRVVNLKVVSDKSPWLRKAELGGVYANVISHGEGRFVAPQETIEALFRAGQVATQYCDLEGRVSTDELWTPNGSYAAIEGITSQDGRIYGKMAHPERIGEHINKNIPLRQDLGIFAAGVAYFRG